MKHFYSLSIYINKVFTLFSLSKLLLGKRMLVCFVLLLCTMYFSKDRSVRIKQNISSIPIEFQNSFVKNHTELQITGGAEIIANHSVKFGAKKQKSISVKKYIAKRKGTNFLFIKIQKYKEIPFQYFYGNVPETNFQSVNIQNVYSINVGCSKCIYSTFPYDEKIKIGSFQIFAKDIYSFIVPYTAISNSKERAPPRISV